MDQLPVRGDRQDDHAAGNVDALDPFPMAGGHQAGEFSLREHADRFRLAHGVAQDLSDRNRCGTKRLRLPVIL